MLTLGERLDLVAARPLARDIAAITGDIRLDASGVGFLGGLCLQLLLAASQQAARMGRGFAVVDASQEFNDALALFGVAPELLEGGAAP
ncbi:MAG: STAS domain-containing protein [Paracoccus sp. (in: a-proteobacteria)]|nr:STAS domain-containing protein [Paracoccus sp. (in: a-proteobacteria)]